MKPVKRGFKPWAMADALNGYLYDFNVYTGATGERETGLGEKVVLTLSESIEGRHHQLFFDNYFTSFSLLDKLLSQGTYALGQTTRTSKSVMRQRNSNVASPCFDSAITSSPPRGRTTKLST